jgi:hypothetical protein
MFHTRNTFWTYRNRNLSQDVLPNIFGTVFLLLALHFNKILGNQNREIFFLYIIHPFTVYCWKYRLFKHCSILYFTGNRHVLIKDVDEIFEILERLLWDHAHQEVRSKVAELLNTLRLRNRACNLVFRYYYTSCIFTAVKNY